MPPLEFDPVRDGDLDADIADEPESVTRAPLDAVRSPWEEPSGTRIVLILGPLLVLELLLWVALFGFGHLMAGGPNGKAFGADYAMFLSGAQALKDGSNPYDHSLLFRTEQTILHGLPTVPRDLRAIVRVGNPPLFFWILEPLTALPFQAGALAWILAMYVFSGLGALATLRELRWRHYLIPCIVFMLMPQVVLGAYYGNIIGLVFAAVAGSLLLSRRFPAVAGIIMSTAWLKPQVALPIVALIVLFHSTRPIRVTAGFVAASLVLLVLSLLTTGSHTLMFWMHGLGGYSQDIGVQKDISSLAGLYIRWAPETVRLLLEAISVVGALLLTVMTWLRVRGRQDIPFLSAAWLWGVWFLATPYAHSSDEMLLTAPLLALIGRDGLRLDWRPVLLVYLLFFSVLLAAFTSATVELYCVVVLVLTVMLYSARDWDLDQAGRRP